MKDETPISCIAGLDSYQTEAFKTAVFPPEIGPLYCAMGVLGEAGELASAMLRAIERLVDVDPDFATEDLLDIHQALASAAKACRVVEAKKKLARKGRMRLKRMPELIEEDRERVRAEAGDVLWYLAGLSNVTQWKLSTVAQENIRKSRERRDANVIASAGETIEERKAHES